MNKKQTLNFINGTGKCVYISCKDGEFLTLAKSTSYSTKEIQIPVTHMRYRCLGEKNVNPLVITHYHSEENSYVIYLGDEELY